MWLLLFSLCLPLQAIGLINNKIHDDVLICATSVTDNNFEECPIWPETGVIPFCVYMRVPSTETKRGESVYGCVYNHELPEDCLENGEFYSQYETIKFRDGKSRSGAMVCCSESYCNRLDDPMAAMVRMTEATTEESIWPAVLISIILVLLTFVPLIQLKLFNRHAFDSQLAEASEFIEDLVVDEDSEMRPPELEHTGLVQELSMNFSTYRKMQSTIRTLSHNYRHTSGTSKNSDSRANLIDEVDEDLKLKDIERDFTIDTTVLVYQKCKELPCPVKRDLPTRYQHLAERLIEHGPYRFKFDPVELGDLFDNVATLLKREPTLLRLEPGIVVFGNLEGNYGDLFRWLHKYGWPPKQRLLFLGGLTCASNEAEEYSLETIALIFALKHMMPQHVYILRGAAETYPMNLRARMPVRIADALADVILRCCQFLPLAALIGHNILACHGCIPDQLDDLQQIAEIRRPLKEVQMGTTAADLIFSKAGTRKGLIGGARGSRFTADFWQLIATGLAPKHFVKLIIRARNSCADGFMFHNARLVTLWSSTSNVPIEWENSTGDRQPVDRPEKERIAGAALYISSELKLTFIRMVPHNTWTGEMIKTMTETRKRDRLPEKKKNGKKAKRSKQTKGSKSKGSTSNPSAVTKQK